MTGPLDSAHGVDIECATALSQTGCNRGGYRVSAHIAHRFVVGVVAMFAVLNWSAFMSETTLSVGFTTVQAPLGLVLLVVTGTARAAVSDLRRLFCSRRSLLENRRQSRELQSQREVAEHAEASRF